MHLKGYNDRKQQHNNLPSANSNILRNGLDGNKQKDGESLLQGANIRNNSIKLGKYTVELGGGVVS